MRILKVSQTYFPYLAEGGRPTKVRGMARALAQKGHRVTVLTTNLRSWHLKTKITNGRVEKSKWGWQAKFEEIEGIEGIEGIEVIYLPTLARYRSITFNPKVMSFCLKRLRDFDIVHIYGIYDLLGAVVAWFCRRQNLPYVVEPIGMYRPIVRSLRKKRIYHRIIGQDLVRGADYLIATSEQEKRELIASGLSEGKVVVRRNGLDLNEFRNLPSRGGFRRELALSDDESLVLYLGRVSRKKGLDLLLQAFASLPFRARLVIIGPDDRDGCLQDLERLRLQLNLQERVVLTAPKFGIEKLQALVDADLFVLPSQNENFGNVAAEAIACGLPVIVTDQCGIAPLLKGQAGLVVPYDKEALRDGIVQFFQDEPLRKQLRDGCADIARQLSWEQPISQMEEVYAQLLV